jgi:shikimate dehydrogenase
MTRLIVLLGDPVAHSLSPRIQNAAMEALGMDGRYLALRCGAEDFPGLLRGIARAGGAGNVTLPHKERARATVEEVTPEARRTGAVNTFWFEDDRVFGDNTDVEGVRGALSVLLAGKAPGGRVLLLGAGGAARASVVALLDQDVDRIDILNRTRERALGLAGDMGGGGSPQRVRVLDGPGDVQGQSWDLVIQATRLGLSGGDPLPLDLEAPARVGGLLDLAYGPRETPLVRRARELGIPAADGGEMLVAQGAASFRRWWGVAAPLEVMRRALSEAREGEG